MSWTARIQEGAGTARDHGRAALDHARSAATRVGEHVGAPGMWKSISESGFGQHVGGHKLAYGAVAAATVGAMAWHMGSKHRENAINAQVASPRLR